MTNDPIWQPTQAHINKSKLYQFMQTVNRCYHLNCATYWDLYHWSIKQPGNFWQMVWDFCQVKASQPAQSQLIGASDMLKAKWFPGAKLNYAENLLKRNDNKLALIFRNEQNRRQTLTYAQLNHKVAKLANALKQHNIKKGDLIAAYMPNMPETVIALLASSSIGAIWSACSPEFGIDGVIERFGQIKPKILFTVDGQTYQGKSFDLLNKITQISQKIPSIENIIITPYLNENPILDDLSNASLFEDFLSSDSNLSFAQLPFEHPLCVMFSSGTTGAPKCIVHGSGATLLQHLKELVLHTDLRPEETIFYYTTCGWMMWNWYISSLAIGSTLVIYDGAATFPSTDTLFNLIDEESICVFGTSASYISLLKKSHLQPNKSHPLNQLRMILSTGSPLLPELFDYVYTHIKTDIMLCSISGGTDILSCFALGNPMLPIYRGELQSPGLGMDVDIFDDQGHSLKRGKGELVCKSPFPSMPLYFFNDPDKIKYQKTYFSKYPGIWAQGDYAALTQHGGFKFYGRSDTVLNPGGVRIGTAEIYRQVQQIDEILESAAIEKQCHGEVKIILFVKLRAGIKLNDKLIAKVKQQLRENMSPRHVPAKVIQINAIPKTINGKIVELAIRNVIHGLPVKNKTALANPECLKEYAQGFPVS